MYRGSSGGLQPDFAAASAADFSRGAIGLSPASSAASTPRGGFAHGGDYGTTAPSNHPAFAEVDERMSAAHGRFRAARRRMDSVTAKIQAAAALSSGAVVDDAAGLAALAVEAAAAERELLDALESVDAAARKTQAAADEQMACADQVIRASLRSLS